MNLIIVESPAKAKTINKYLGQDYIVLASYGHVRDLWPKSGAVEPEKNFTLHYEVVEKNFKHLETIAKTLKKADTLLLATDPDREGEAIAWHIAEYLQEKKLLKNKSVKRLVFYEITKNSVHAALNQLRDISMDLVDAQQTRRALDYLVGFNLSPLLWKKIKRGLSAGRVQSPALRLIVEREAEIKKFITQEYWTIEADFIEENRSFSAKLVEYQGKKYDPMQVHTEKEALDIRDHLLNTSGNQLTVSAISKKEKSRHPAAPFTTSTLQQEAVRKLGFTTQRTMRVAQQLYEGITLDGETTGLITYMRTDSVNLAKEAIDNLRHAIVERYGKNDLPAEARVFKNKAKNAQEAHEAIRPTDPFRSPESIKNTLSPEQYKLYDLIWKRTLACQMISATLDQVSIDLACGEKKEGLFRATGTTIKIPGFMNVYLEDQDDSSDEEEKNLPLLKKGQMLALQAIKNAQHFTEPPPRYTEASLVKALEEYGIGRPSTYASIISTLQQRHYALLEKKRFQPTDIGEIVNKFLTQYFSHYVDYEFTANLENDLDAIAEGQKKQLSVLENFWGSFEKKVKEIDTQVKRSDVTHEALNEKCPQCEKPLSIRLGRGGRFIGCDGFPDCTYTRSLNEEENKAAAQAAEILADRRCPHCQGGLMVRTGRYGKFIGCTNYPKCKYIESLNKPKETGVSCPECQQSILAERRSRFGKIFYSCLRYPECRYAIWNEPIKETCPNCAWPLLTLKVTKRRGKEKVCPKPGCGFAEAVEAN